MKYYFYLLLSTLMTIVSLHGEDVTTLDGKIYKNIRLSAEEQETVKFMHDGGVSVVKKKNLPASFLAAHELQSAPVEANDNDDTNRTLMSVFAKRIPIFHTKDGKEYKSADIRKVDAGGLMLFTSSGPVHLKFADLPQDVKDAFDYDPVASAKFESDQRDSMKKAAAQQLRFSNAASQVDNSAVRVRLYLSQNLGRSWLCVAEILKDIDREVVVARQGSSLSNPSTAPSAQVAQGRTIYEATKVQETVVTGNLGPFALFGMPDYHRLQSDVQGRRTWSGYIYRFGRTSYRTEKKAKDDPDEIAVDAYEMDRSKAIKLVASNGALASYSTGGDPSLPAKEHGSFSGNGTGFAISDDGYIATDAHVVKNAMEVTVLVKGSKIPAKTVVTDEAHDLAILKVENVPTKALELLPTGSLQLGQELFTIGFPAADIMGLNAKLTRGHLNALSGLRDDPTIIQTSAQIEPGNSGGPLCDNSGRVVGIIRSTSSIQHMADRLGGATPQNVNFATKSEFLATLAAQVPALKLAIPGSGISTTTPERRVEESDFLVFVRGNE